MSMDNLEQMVKTLSPEVLPLLSQFSHQALIDLYPHLLNSAIAVDNRQVIDYCLREKSWLNFEPAIDPAIKKLVKRIQDSGSADTEKWEQDLIGALGPDIHFARTPLLQACRYKNLYALEKLFAAGAKSQAKDLLGKTCLEICFDIAGIEFSEKFLLLCRQYKIKYVISLDELRQATKEPNYYANLLNENLSRDAMRFAFSIACAYLDVEQVNKWLCSGFLIQDAFSEFHNPVIEAVTSYSLSVYGLPDPDNLSHLFRRELPENPIAIDFEEAEKIYLDSLQDPDKKQNFLDGPRLWRKEIVALYARKRHSGLTPEAQNIQLQKRLVILDRLAWEKVDPRKVEENYFYYYPEFFFCMGEVSILQKLRAMGISLSMDHERKIDLEVELKQRGLPEIIEYLASL